MRDVKALLEGEAYPKFAADRQLIDLFEAYPEKLTAEQLDRPCCGRFRAGFIRWLRASRRIPAKRIFWLARCAGNHTGEVRKGVSSTYLGERRKVGRRRALRQAEPALPSAARRPYADHHDRRRHRRCALSGLRRRARCGPGQGQELALLRRAELHQRLSLSARMAGLSGVRRSVHESTLHSRAISRKRSMSSIACGNGARSCRMLASGRRASLRLR